MGKVGNVLGKKTWYSQQLPGPGQVHLFGSGRKKTVKITWSSYGGAEAVEFRVAKRTEMEEEDKLGRRS